MILAFDKFTVDTDLYELKCDGEIRRVEPRVFDLIAHLAAHPDQVFSREALIDAVWNGRIVSDATVATCVKNARKALDDTGGQQNRIQTVRNRGFRFAATVIAEQPDEEPTGTSTTPESGVEQHEGIDRDPSLLILPFRCLSDDPELHRTTQSLAMDLSTILTRIPLLRLSTQARDYERFEAPPTARQLHDELGIDFLIEGVVKTSGDRLTANVQLSDAKSGYRLWAEAFDLSEPLVDAPEKCIGMIVAKLEPQLNLAMYRSARAADGRPTARQLFLEAHGLLVTQGWHHESFTEAIALLRQSIGLDRQFALSRALLALLIGFGARVGLASDPSKARSEVLDSAEQALRLDSMDSTVLGYAGCSLADVGDLDRGESLLRNAIDLNPANAQALVALGAVRIAQFDLDDAIELLAKGIEISPLDSRLSVWGAVLSIAHLLSGDVAAAVTTAQTACRRNDRTYMPRVALAAARLAQEDSKRALRALADARRIKPDLSSHQIAAMVGPDFAEHLLALEASAQT